MNQTQQFKRYLLRGLIIIMLLLQIVPALRLLPLVPHFAILFPIWFTVLFLSKPEMLTTSEFLLAVTCYFLYLIYEVFGVYFGLDLRVISTLFDVFYYMLYAMSIFAYFRKEHDVEGFNMVTKQMYRMIIFTAVTTFVALLIHPQAVRNMAAGSTLPALRKLYMSMNVAEYDFIFGIGILAPFFLILYLRLKKKWFLGLFILFSLVVLMGQLMGAIITYIISTVLLLLVYKKPTVSNYFTKMVIIGAIALFLSAFLADALRFVGTELGSDFEQVSQKTFEIASYLEGGEVINEEENINTAGYQERFDTSYNGFLSSPYVGGAPSGGHHFWMDMLAENGIIGTLPLVFFFVLSYRIFSKYITKNFRVFHLHFIVIFVSVGLTKNIVLQSMPIWIFFIIPAFLIKYNDIYNDTVYGNKK